MIRRTGKDLVAAARAMLGTKFRHQARRPGQALDCVGLVVCATSSAGFKPIDLKGYSMRPDGVSMRKILSMQCDELAKDDLRDGNLIAFTELRPGWPHHLAIVTSNGIIHASNDVGCVVEHSMSDEWRSCIDSVWRIRGMED